MLFVHTKLLKKTGKQWKAINLESVDFSWQWILKVIVVVKLRKTDTVCQAEMPVKKRK
jgi:hypothetical protein